NPEALKELTTEVIIRTRRSSVADVLGLPARRPTNPSITLTPPEGHLYRDTARFLRDLYKEGFFQPTENEEIEDLVRRRRRTGKGIFILEVMRLLQRLTSSSPALAASLQSLSQGDLITPDYRVRAQQLAERSEERRVG